MSKQDARPDCPGAPDRFFDLSHHKATCPVCGRYIRLTTYGHLYKHKPRKGRKERLL